MTARRWTEEETTRRAAEIQARMRAGQSAGVAAVQEPLPLRCEFDEGKPKRSKYGAHRVEVDGLTFDSKKEARRWQQLQLLQHAGQIEALDRQVRFSLDVNGVHIADYVCDFWYLQDGKRIVEDVKSAATSKIQSYRIKAKLMLACHGINVQEV